VLSVILVLNRQFPNYEVLTANCQLRTADCVLSTDIP